MCSQPANVQNSKINQQICNVRLRECHKVQPTWPFPIDFVRQYDRPKQIWWYRRFCFVWNTL